jgi:PDZ domain-containing protein
MSRRTAAGLLAVLLTVAFGAWSLSLPVNYVTFRPGPTFNVLGTLDGKPILTITGHKTYPDDGQLRMVTVYQSSPDAHLDLFGMLAGWVDPNVALIPRDVVFPNANTTDQQAQQQSAAEMTSSQDAATAAALNALHLHYDTQLRVATVTKGLPAAGKLQAGDILVAVDGAHPAAPLALANLIRAHAPGTSVAVTVLRNGVRRTLSMTTVPAPDDKKASRIGIGIDLAYVFPFTVKINVGENVGGPSAGMMFALSIYDLLTPGSLTGGRTIAGSGEISTDGTVGQIGGIGQKIVAAQRDGARLFLVASDNCAEALTAHYDPAKIRLVRVHTLTDAIDAVQAWRQNPNASLPGCGS